MTLIKKPWGQEELLEVNDKYVVKRLTMNPGHRCSLQYHNNKLETIYCLSGVLHVDDDNESTTLVTGDVITIPPGKVHRMSSEIGSVYLECSTTELDDVVRIKDDYERN